MANRAWRILLGCLLAFWLGGLTFYALIVVPAGTELWGATDQGALTRHVTYQLNWIGSVVLGVLAIDAVRLGRRRLTGGGLTANWLTANWLTVCWLLMCLAQVALWFLHGQLTPYVDLEDRLVDDYGTFYTIHRIYLLATAGQWAAGLAYFAAIIAPRPGNSNPANSSTGKGDGGRELPGEAPYSRSS